MTSGREALKVVVDTNVIVSGLINPFGAPRRLRLDWFDEAFVLIVTHDLIAEYVRVLHRRRLIERYGLSIEERTFFLGRIHSYAVMVDPAPMGPLQVRDRKDEPVLAAALGGQADYLVSGDEDLLVLRDEPRLGPLKIVTVREFMAEIEQSR